MGKDEELFLRAMETLGVKGKRGPGRAKGDEGAVEGPRITDDGVDFDALMRGGRGPAKLMPEAKRARGGQAEAEPQEAPSKAQEPAVRPDPKDYQASADEVALFEAAVRSATPPVRDGVPGPRPRSVDDGIERDLKRGEVEPDAVLDLHGRTREEAGRRLRRFLEEAVREKWRVVAIICGRGLHSERGEPVLRPFVVTLLNGELRTFVRRHMEAPRGLGGGGTVLVEMRLELTG